MGRVGIRIAATNLFHPICRDYHVRFRVDWERLDRLERAARPPLLADGACEFDLTVLHSGSDVACPPFQGDRADLQLISVERPRKVFRKCGVGDLGVDSRSAEGATNAS